MNSTISISAHTYHLLAEEAGRVNRSADELADEVLARHLAPPHPYITLTGPSAMIKGTSIPVYIVVGYIQRADETLENLAATIMPHVSLAAVYDALSYYYDHKEEIDREVRENSVEASQKYLREHLGEEGYRRLTGQSK